MIATMKRKNKIIKNKIPLIIAYKVEINLILTITMYTKNNNKNNNNL